MPLDTLPLEPDHTGLTAWDYDDWDGEEAGAPLDIAPACPACGCTEAAWAAPLGAVLIVACRACGWQHRSPLPFTTEED